MAATQIAEILNSPKLTPLISLVLAGLVLLYHEDGRSVGETIVASLGAGADKKSNRSKTADPVLERPPPASGTTTRNNTDSQQQENTCELPSCELVLQSRMYSERCGSAPAKWPLLITGTPRSATVYTTNLLQSHGMSIQNDWANPRQHGSVSWIFAFEDDNNFGPARTGGGTFRHVLHQLKDPLDSIASMCTEPIFDGESAFLQRHVYMPSFYEQPQSKARAALEFWVEWHDYLKKMKLPAYKVENVTAESIFEQSGLESAYREEAEQVSSATNSREHRPSFSWQELYTLDPRMATRAWKLAREFGYNYPNVDFDTLTCLPSVPSCENKTDAKAQSKCKAGTHPFPREKLGAAHLSKKRISRDGWVDGGCIERKAANGTFVGVPGPIKFRR